MNIKISLIGIPAFVVLASTSLSAAAGTDMEEALNNGAQQLTADEIAERVAGKTVTYLLPDKKEVQVHYGAENAASGRMVGGDWSDTGYYGITNSDRICISWSESDEGRLRCFSVLVVDDVVKKFHPDGRFAMEAVEFEDGNIL
ncbi:hypothetical protein MKP05_05130 [Halomonas sp. EGI 63088]|uniref:Uncharacterized protein n=1 Tax=Halomonas flagellata TaxID=2920385 RepID=A0ABS9RRM9_9GAMM|nr:hypothetical protein [Halomonas flagellata]MCH4562518.1 hypothetical protein [Halomonas flagellata]